MRRGLLLLGACLWCAGARGQLPVEAEPGANLFDDSGASSQARPALPGYSQALILQNDEQVRGTLVSLDSEEIVWTRPDAGLPLRFPRASVRRIVLGLDADRHRVDRVPAPIRATVRLPGADWLFGDLASADGQNFALKVGAESSLAIPRTQIDWFSFGAAPAASAGYAGNEHDLDTSYGTAVMAGGRIENGLLTLKKGEWVGCSFAQRPRFEIDFSIAEGAEEGARLLLGHSIMGPNSRSSRTVDLELGPAALCSEIGFFGENRATLSLPDEAKGGHGPVSYRILYGAPKDHIVVLRNGRRAAELALPRPLANHGEGELFFSLDRERGDLKLGRFSVRPWDGLIPQADEAPHSGDCLSLGAALPEWGKLETVDASSVTFTGMKKALEPGLFVKLENRPAPLPGADSRLVFGDAGVLSAAQLRVENGRVHARTVLPSDLDLPIAAVRQIWLARSTAPFGESKDVLVFKDGDELPGNLLAAAPGERLQWRTPSGQELDFDPAHIAGLRFASGDRAAQPRRLALAILRDGDRLRGECLSLDERTDGHLGPGSRDAKGSSAA